MKFEQLRARLKEKREPCYYIYGDDPFLLDNALSAFTALITDCPDFNISRMPDSAFAQDVADACEILPLMCGLRLVIVSKLPDKNKAESDRLKKCVSELPEGCCLIFYNAASVENEFTRWLEKSTVPVDCGRLDERTLTKWIGRRCAQKNKQITESAASLLIAYCDRYLTRIATELDKLCYAGEGIISEGDVKNLVSPALEFKIFELGDALSARDGDKAMRLVKGLLDLKYEPTAIISTMAGYFRRLLFCAVNRNMDESGLAQQLGVKEGAVRFAAKNARLFTPVKLKAVNDFCHAADNDIKSGRMGAENALNLVCLKVLNI